MSFSYTPGGQADRDDIRAAIGDTESSVPASERLEDEEIDRLLTLTGSRDAAKPAAARALIAKLSRRATEKTIGSLRLVYSQRIEALWKLVRDLEAGAAGAALPYAGGISRGDRENVEADSDRVEPAFRTGMLDNPRTS